MFLLSDNEQLYVINTAQKTANIAEKNGRIAFGIMGEVANLNTENATQLDKILASVQQNRDNTLLLNLSYTDISISQIKQSGAKALVVFANYIPEVFASMNVKIGLPFSISSMEIFISPDLESLQKNTAAKMALWNFMKFQI